MELISMQASGKFKVQSWEEDRYADTKGAALARASVTQAFSGDIEGEGAVEWLMCYRPDKGRLGERSGDFVLQTSGTFDGEKAQGVWTVVPGSGSGELQGLRGKGELAAPMGPEATANLEFDFD